ncbi:peptidoglycan DD-metalloendopeptidase family protein [Candidatus Poriferisocius sp.]|uniref:peptidoglycan DD-metalloendopeptidase family protein n=1 Tax=Candidatus Poriferisocius sp. TaxID=3101276 RepID=UPI003B02039D
MVLGMRIGGLAAAAVSAWLALHPAQLPPETSPQTAPKEESAESPLVYQPPVDAEVIDSFRAPAHVGAPGNRGLEYNPEPGLPVRASAAGEVVFAGSVAHNRFVTVLHRDGLRTAYGYLGWTAVEEGEWVAPGQLLGTTSARFFFSVRDGDHYLDPTLVLAAGHVRLVPHLEPHGRSRLPAYGSDRSSGYR